MKRFSTLVLGLIFVNQIYAYEYLYVSDVRNSWWWETGNIQDAYITVEQKGMYAHCSLILNYNTNQLPFADGDSLEINMNFNLPESAVVTDLFLWIEDEPVRAEIYDKWTAYLIYESIVKRRIDPAILTKVGNNEYNIRIFPLMANMPRQIQIDYLQPLQNAGSALATLPLPHNILKLSGQEPNFIKVFYKGNEAEGLHLLEDTDLNFEKISHPDGNQYLGTIVDNPFNYSSLTLQFVTKTSDIELSVFKNEDSEEGYFQLYLNPGSLFNGTQNKKALFLMDFIDNKCSQLNTDEVLDQLESSICTNFSGSDSINVLFSGGATQFMSNGWISCSDTNISDYFSIASNSVFNTYSNLPNLLTDAIHFLDSTNTVCPLVLISSSGKFGSNTEANGLITDILDLIGERDIPVFVIDLNDTDNEYTYIGNQYYFNNNYLYSFLTQLTKGEMFSIKQNSFTLMLNKSSSKLRGYVLNIDVDIEDQGGYTYSEYEIIGTNGLSYFDEPYLLTGKYVGEAPFDIAIHAQLPDGKLLLAEETISSGELIIADSTIKTLWASNYLSHLISREQNNSVASQIISLSIDERILTTHTAFLVLEPGFIPDVEYNENGEVIIPEDDWIITPVDEEIVDEGLNFTCYPNPATDFVRVKYNLLEDAKVRVEIYNTNGKLVGFSNEEFHLSGIQTTEIDINELFPGFYIVKIKINDEIIDQTKLLVY